MNYQRGDKGTVIRCAQHALHLMRVYRMDIDDSFGPGMEQAILDYQADRELEETGTLNDQTWECLKSDVLPIQRALKNKGYYNGSVNGIALTSTYEAFLEFQEDNGLEADGFFGPASRQALYGSSSGSSSASGDNALPYEKGDRGSNILDLQAGLTVLCCHPGDLDGSFGPQVEEAVRVFEGKYGLEEDGVFANSDLREMQTQLRPIQQALVEAGYELRNVTGAPDESFYQVLREFQRDQGLVVDGQAGPATRAALGIAKVYGNDDFPLSRGSKGYNVLCLQYALRMVQIDPNGFDGSFGGGCESAVERYQERNGLKTDGVVGTNTWEALRKDIRPIQEALINKGYDIGGSADGVATPDTYNAVLAFQEDNGLEVDGLVGTSTKAALGISSDGTVSNITSAALRRGSKGQLVRYLQKVFNYLGYSPSIDGSYGPGMEEEVKQFQTDHSLEVDGKFGPASWSKLFEVYNPGSGTGVQKLLSVAEHELSLGFEEDTDSDNNALNITPYGQWYASGMNGQAWCAMFVTFCARKAGLADTVVPVYCYCPTGMEWYRSRGRFFTRGSHYVPKPGDTIFFYSSDLGRVAHTGLVAEVTDDYVYTIEGNAADAVRKRYYNRDDTSIEGYGCNQTAPQMEVRPKEEVDEEVKAMFRSLLGFHGFTYLGGAADSVENQVYISSASENVTAQTGPGTGRSAMGTDARYYTVTDGEYDEITDGPVLQRYKLNIMFHSEGDKLTNLVQDIGAFLGNGTLGVRAEREGDWAVVKILYSFAYENTEGDTAYKYLLVTHKITLTSYEEILLDMTAVNDVWSNASSQFQTDPSTELNFAMNRMYSGQEYRDGSLTWNEFMYSEVTMFYFASDGIYRAAMIREILEKLYIPTNPEWYHPTSVSATGMVRYPLYRDPVLRVYLSCGPTLTYDTHANVVVPLDIQGGFILDENIWKEAQALLTAGTENSAVSTIAMGAENVAATIYTGKISIGVTLAPLTGSVDIGFEIAEKTFSPYLSGNYTIQITMEFSSDAGIHEDLEKALGQLYPAYAQNPDMLVDPGKIVALSLITFLVGAALATPSTSLFALGVILAIDVFTGTPEQNMQ